MVSVNDFKTLSIELDRVNSYIPPIIINEADNNGRHLKFTPTYEGQPVTGITSARMYYDPRPRDASSIGDYVDGTKDGDGWVFVIPPNTFTANVQGIASVSFTDADGETYTRSMPIDVEPGGTKIDSQGTRIDRLIATLEQMVNDFTMTADTETGPAGSQASVNVTRLSNGSYKLDFTIPTGQKGPKGDPGDLTTVTHDDTLTGDGTSDTPLGIASGLNFSNFDTKLTWATPLSSVNTPGMHRILGNTQDSPDGDIPDFIKGRTNVAAILLVYKNSSSFLKIMYVQYADVVGHMVRCFGKTYTDSGSSAWIDLNHSGSTVSALTSRVTALEAKLNELAVTQTRLQALETRIKSSETNQ